MTNVLFYKNGFVIRGHTKPEICSELSLFSWTVANMILNLNYGGEYYTSPDDNSDAGYGHLIINCNMVTELMLETAKQMLPIWAEKYGWDQYVTIQNMDETFVIPENFKELEGIKVA